jgi:hypothetical protein
LPPRSPRPSDPGDALRAALQIAAANVVSASIVKANALPLLVIANN